MFQIKKMRERTGMGQQEVAEALGITKRRYGGWEREEREINLRDAIHLADLFGCTLDELAGREWPRIEASLTPEEREILDAYRDTDLRGQDNIITTARREKRSSHEQHLQDRAKRSA